MEPEKRGNIIIGVESIYKYAPLEYAGKFDITLWSSSVLRLRPGLEITNTIRKHSDFHIYEITQKKNRKLFLEVTPCIGTVEFYIHSNLSDIDNHKATTSMDKGRLFHQIPSGSKNMFVKVRALHVETMYSFDDFQNLFDFESLENKGVRYTIQTHESNSTRRDDFYLENDGRIEYSVLETGEVQLNWGKVFLNTDSEEKNVEKVVYSVHLKEFPTVANMDSVCGIMYGEPAANPGHGLTSTNFTFRPVHGKTYDFVLHFNKLDIL